MAEINAQINLKGRDDLSRKLRDIERRLDKMSGSMKKVKRSTDKTNKSITKINKNFTGLGSAAKGAAASLGLIFGVKAVADTLKAGIAYSSAREELDAYLSLLDTSTKTTLPEWRRLTRGQVDDLELLETAGRAATIGLFKSQASLDDFNRLLQLSLINTQATGRSFQTAFGELFESFRAKEIGTLLRRIGIESKASATSIADFKEQFREGADAAIAAAPNIVTAADRFAELTAKLRNLRNELAEKIVRSDEFDKLLEKLTTFVTNLDVDKIVRFFGEFAKGLKAVAQVFIDNPALLAGIAAVAIAANPTAAALLTAGAAGGFLGKVKADVDRRNESNRVFREIREGLDVDSTLTPKMTEGALRILQDQIELRKGGKSAVDPAVAAAVARAQILSLEQLDTNAKIIAVQDSAHAELDIAGRLVGIGRKGIGSGSPLLKLKGQFTIDEAQKHIDEADRLQKKSAQMIKDRDSVGSTSSAGATGAAGTSAKLLNAMNKEVADLSGVLEAMNKVLPTPDAEFFPFDQPTREQLGIPEFEAALQGMSDRLDIGRNAAELFAQALANGTEGLKQLGPLIAGTFASTGAGLIGEGVSVGTQSLRDNLAKGALSSLGTVGSNLILGGAFTLAGGLLGALFGGKKEDEKQTEELEKIARNTDRSNELLSTLIGAPSDFIFPNVSQLSYAGISRTTFDDVGR